VIENRYFSRGIPGSYNPLFTPRSKISSYPGVNWRQNWDQAISALMFFFSTQKRCCNIFWSDGSSWWRSVVCMFAIPLFSQPQSLIVISSMPGNGRGASYAIERITWNTKHTLDLATGLDIILHKQPGISVTPPYFQPCKPTRVRVNSQVQPKSESPPLVVLVNRPKFHHTCRPKLLASETTFFMSFDCIRFDSAEKIIEEFPSWRSIVPLSMWWEWRYILWNFESIIPPQNWHHSACTHLRKACSHNLIYRTNRLKCHTLFYCCFQTEVLSDSWNWFCTDFAEFMSTCQHVNIAKISDLIP